MFVGEKMKIVDLWEMGVKEKDVTITFGSDEEKVEKQIIMRTVGDRTPAIEYAQYKMQITIAEYSEGSEKRKLLKELLKVLPSESLANELAESERESISDSFLKTMPNPVLPIQDVENKETLDAFNERKQEYENKVRELEQQRNKLIEEKISFNSQEYRGRDDLREKVLDTRLANITRNVFAKGLTCGLIFYATFKSENRTERYFPSIAIIENLNQQIFQQLLIAYNEIEIPFDFFTKESTQIEDL